MRTAIKIRQSLAVTDDELADTAGPDRVVGQPAGRGENRYGCLVVGGFWLTMIALLWVPPLFALAWAVIGLVCVSRPGLVVRRLNAGSTVSTRSVPARMVTAMWRSPFVIRLLGTMILMIVAVGILAET